MTLVVASNVQCAFSESFTCISSCSRVFRPQVWWWVGANSKIYPGVKYTQQSGRVLGAVIGAVMHTFMSRCCSHTCPALRAQRVFSVVQLLSHFTSIPLGASTPAVSGLSKSVMCSRIRGHGLSKVAANVACSGLAKKFMSCASMQFILTELLKFTALA